ncbi:MAG: nucleoside-diphosphate sugar epimerase/dehydratase, partial [Burkholderiaceae bacterium]
MIRVFSHYISIRIVLLVLIESVLLFAASLAGVAVRLSPVPFDTEALFMPEAILFAFFMIVVMAALGLYQDERPESFVAILNRTIIAFAAGSALMSVVFYLFPNTYICRGVFAYTATFAFGAIPIVRTVFFQWTAFGLIKKKILILGAGEQARAILDLVSSNKHRDAIEVVGV